MSEINNQSIPKKTVKLKWNDKDLEVPEGTNLLKAALDNGIEVAHYCYHAGLSVAGVCRMCMVEQQGVPRPFPSCNAMAAEGMQIRNDTKQIKDAVENTLMFHLINHPLDCPVCDQAGECGLQDYYMKHGQYDSTMIDQKVHKDKVQDIGRDVMLDAERCILCARCTRFVNEVTKSNELGIVNRGDHAEISVLQHLNNGYAQNLVDICPVGALTSKDFRFKQRVWFLENVDTTCIGCETGCSVKVSQNKTGSYRVKPKIDSEVNGFWMCDDGRQIYHHVSVPGRLAGPVAMKNKMFLPVLESEVSEAVKGKNVKFILSGSLSNEEYQAFFLKFKQVKNVALYLMPKKGEDFDGLLKRSDKNANTKGAQAAFSQAGADPSEFHLHQLLNGLSSSDVLVIALPELVSDNDHLLSLLSKIKKAKIKIALTSDDSRPNLQSFDFLLPVPTFLEKEGHVTNFEGRNRKLNKGFSYGAVDKNIEYYAGLFH